MAKETANGPVPPAKRTNDRPDPAPFMFRKQTAGESDKEYADLMARAKLKFNAGKSGRAKAIKGMVQARKGP